MALYLVQHGHSLSSEDDPEHGLSDQGIMEVQFIAEIVRSRDIPVSRIVHSGKKRASQTAHIFMEELQPNNGLASTSGLNPMDDVKAVAGSLDPSKNEMLIGHLPFMEKLVSYLITGSEQIPVVKFQHGGIVCLDRLPKNGAWIIKWTLFPGV